MKHVRSICLLFFCVCTLSLSAQTLESIAQRLKLFGQSVPQEEVFVHMDNTCYYLGDTICYKAYMRLSDGRPSPLSRVLYVELLNHDGYLVERQKVEMTRGQGHGTFCLPDTLYAGYYELRAYTRWQLNWGETEHPRTKNADMWFYNKEMARQYYRDYEKLYSRVFPVYSKPQQDGKYNQLMNMRPIRRYEKQKNPDREATVTFFPEGGSLIAGTQCRVAYEARNIEGERLDGKLTVLDRHGNVVAESEVKHRGRGDFLLDCKAGEKFHAEFAWRGDHKDKYDLPKVEDEGVALQAKATEEGITLKLAAVGASAQEELGVTVSTHGIQHFFSALPAGTTDLLVPMDSLETGVAQVTVFNAEGRIYADRLVFVRKGSVPVANVTVQGVQADEYRAYEPIDFTLKGQPGATLSVAVRDHANSDATFDSGSMLTEMLLCSQIKGFVENPQYYFANGDDLFRQYALDLLLLVQGWRRYSWHDMATPGAFALKHPYERTEVLTGSVNRYTPEFRENPTRYISMYEMGMKTAEGGTEAQKRDAIVHDAGLMAESMREYLIRYGMFPARASVSTSTESNLSVTTPSGLSDYSTAVAIDMDDAGSAPIESAISTSSVDLSGGAEQVSADGSNGEMGVNLAACIRGTYEWASSRFINEKPLDKEVLVHAEFVQPFAKQGEKAVEGDMETQDGMFRIATPIFQEQCFFFLGASDTTKWKAKVPHRWITTGYDKNKEVEWPEYYVKLNFHYPRFPKQYDFYQQNQPMDNFVGNPLAEAGISDAVVMKQVLVGANKGGMTSFDKRYPAFTLDAYEAFNATVDAGLCPGYYMGSIRFTTDVARTYIGDMNMDRAYFLETRYNTRNSYNTISKAEQDKYNILECLDSVYVYTDYSPRLEGDPRYSQSNQPFVVVDIRKYDDNVIRDTWCNRRLLLQGFSTCEETYQPDYSALPEGAKPADYRRTLYWNPDVQLDEQGEAIIRCYNNARPTLVKVSAEGMGKTGDPQSL